MSIRESFSRAGGSVTAAAVVAALVGAAIVASSLNLSGNLTVGGDGTFSGDVTAPLVVSDDIHAIDELAVGTVLSFGSATWAASELGDTDDDVSIRSGTADPSGSVSAMPGSVYMRKNGASSALYRNTSAGPGAGTAWTALGSTTPTFSGASVYHSTTQTATSTVALLLVYDTENFDVGGYHSVASQTSRMVAPSTGYYYVRAGGTFQASSNGYRELSVHKNSNGLYNSANIVLVDIRAPNAASNTTWLNANGIVSLTAGDYLEVFALHDAGVNLTVARASYVPFQMELVGQ